METDRRKARPSGLFIPSLVKVRRQKGTGTEYFGVYRPDPELTADFATYQQQDSGRVNLLSFFDPEMGRIIPTPARHGRLDTSLSSLPPGGPFRPQTHLEAGGLGAGGCSRRVPARPAGSGRHVGGSARGADSERDSSFPRSRVGAGGAARGHRRRSRRGKGKRERAARTRQAGSGSGSGSGSGELTQADMA